MVALSFPPFQGSLSEGNDVMSRSHAPARKLCMCLLECVYVGVFVPASGPVDGTGSRPDFH